MRELHTEIEIQAPADRVWQILTDLTQYPSWNPFITEAEGEVREGATLTVRIAPPGGNPMTFTPTVLRATPNEEFRWLGRLVLPGIFDGEHRFELTPTPEGGTHLVQSERFRGFLVPLLWRSLDKNTRRGFELMNQALKERAEAADP